MQRLLTLTLLIFSACNPLSSEQKAGICISFDDRYIEEWQEVSELLKKYNAKATFFITQFDSLDQSEIALLKEFENNGNEIASHGNLHVNAEIFIIKHSYSKYLEDEIEQSIKKMEEHGFKPQSFAYPYGAKYWFTDFLLSRHFQITRGVADLRGIDNISTISDIFYDRSKNSSSINALNIDKISNLKKEDFINGMNEAVETNTIFMLFGHYPSKSSEDNPYSFDIKTLEYILENAKNLDLKFYTVSELKKE